VQALPGLGGLCFAGNALRVGPRVVFGLWAATHHLEHGAAGAVCGGPSWPYFAAATSTWRPAPCESFGNWPSRPAADSRSVRPSPQAGQRTVVFPDLIAPDLAWHLARFVGGADGSLLFTSPTGSREREDAGWPG